MSRTTLTIDDKLLRELKRKAADEGKTLQAVLNDLLRHALAMPRKAKDYSLKLRGWRASEQPGVDILDRDKLFDLMNGR
jgi:hypothetical protein